ncbi:hypothetical protein [Azospira sp. I13]|jgi:hypothetical protein|uniref:hypothetical protein n=1 Tax=Azospira sp. I13 TaxID=1765050 RepID=UPI001058271B|nr:hypothetical protein [Azospira sp. I13]
MSHPLHIEGTRVCVLIHPDEVVVCSNTQGFNALGQWMAWLAESKPEEFYHFHLLRSLLSEACIFEGVTPSNVWVLRTPPTHQVISEPPEGFEAIPFEVTFQVVPEASLDDLVAAQSTGFIPSAYLKSEASYAGTCG